MKARFEKEGIASFSVELPAKDAAEFVASGATADEIRTLIEKSKRDETDGNNGSSNDGNSSSNSNNNTPSENTSQAATTN